MVKVESIKFFTSDFTEFRKALDDMSKEDMIAYMCFAHGYITAKEAYKMLKKQLKKQILY